MQGDRRQQYLQALGVDVWVSRRAGVDRVATQVVAQPVTPPSRPAADIAPSRATLSPQAPIAVERPLVQSGPKVPVPNCEALWSALKGEVANCKRCGLHATRTQTVFGVGDPLADWMVIGEAPGAEEDRRGEPFVGAAGQLLNAMLKAIGLAREAVYIANILKSRPPGNRDPKPEEVEACFPYLTRQIALIRPKLILAVGRIAAQNLLGTTVPLGRLRGQVHSFGELGTPLIVTYHPAYLLRSPGEKRKAWEDLKFARDFFQRQTQQAS